ncbi:hypothetical protein HQ587_08130 [bacterium]|nr:hypothetical protein [bacterium]
MPVILTIAAIAGITGCLNPFAPIEGDVGKKIWTDQSTVGELLDNFALAYDYRDSLHYADCLHKTFEFRYYDVNAGHSDRWFRETDLKATGGMFHAFDRIDLEWNSVPDTVRKFSAPGDTLDFLVGFNLTFGNEVPLMGYARFSVSMVKPDTLFRILAWRDDFINE